MSPAVIDPESSPATTEPRMPGPGHPLTDLAGEFDRATVQRYARHIATPGIGMVGQRRWSAARVAVVGLGGLASPVLEYLAGAGVAEILVADVDAVELSNLQRKPIFATEWVGRPKVEAAVAAKKTTARAGHHELSQIVRGFVSKASGLKAETMTAADLRERGPAHLADLIEQYYPRQFGQAEADPPSFARSASAARDVVGGWS